LPSAPAGGRAQETREFGTTRRQLLEVADWLQTWGVTRAGMEATGDYWRPKTDKLDSVWLAKMTERGSLAGSFVPPQDIRRLRTHTRYRRKLTQARTAEKQQVEKLLEDALDCSSFTEKHAEQQADTRRLTRTHVRSLERLGYKVTIEPVDPQTGELPAKARDPAPRNPEKPTAQTAAGCCRLPG
jgi:transposase